MRKIIGIDRPFDMVKQFLVYEDGQEIGVCSATDENRVEVLFELMKKYDVKQVDLVGPKAYLSGIKEQIETANVSKYEFTDLEINII